ncbi:hypothetical protein [Roseovarius sp. ZX-A-9]|uniref:hypothetical protein n=1 Tax=Roseovarius sp. ZX-A-9 TaxID=3014783 RepID=UPI00232FD783|nr:hypothetical protein [Roseovarius sp. ZX-A-9]
MSHIPDDITPIVREIDHELKAEGISPVGRPMNAIIKFGQRFKMSILFVKPHSAIDDELMDSWKYAERIYEWYREVYGDQIKLDPSADGKVAVLADGDLWELRLPIIYGPCAIVVDRKLSEMDDKAHGSSRLNACDALFGITQTRLEYFRDTDLDEVYGMFLIGMDVRNAFARFINSSRFFREAQSDWKTAVMHMTSQNPNYGQARWASLQFAEKFMKGLTEVIGVVSPIPQTHNLKKLHDALARSIVGLSLENLLVDIQCSAAVRYGEEPSTRDQSYSAHKSSLLLVRALGSVENANNSP